MSLPNSTCLAVPCGSRLFMPPAGVRPAPAARATRLLAFGAAAERIHQVDDLARLGLARDSDGLALLFLAQQILQRILIVVLEFLRIEMAGFRFDDVRGKLKHVLRHAHARDGVEIVLLVADFVGVAKRDAQNAFPARLERGDMFTRGQHHAPQSDHPLLLDGIADHSESLHPNVSIGNDVIRIRVVEFVDFLARDKLIDLDHVFAFECDRFKLLGLDLDVVAFLQLITLDDFVAIDLIAGFGIDLQVSDAMAGFSVELVEIDFLALRRRRIERDRTRDQREAKKSLPISAWGHEKAPRHAKASPKQMGEWSTSAWGTAFPELSRVERMLSAFGTIPLSRGFHLLSCPTRANFKRFMRRCWSPA